MKKTLLAFAAAAALSTGCPSADPGTVPDDVPNPDGVPYLDLGADYAVDAGKTFPGLATVPNVDDDNANGTPDWEDNADGSLIDGDNDLVALVVPASVWVGVEDGVSYRLNLNGQVRNFRVWYGGEIVLGEIDGENQDTWALPRTDGALELLVEAKGVLDQAWIALEKVEGGDAVDNDWTFLTASPLILNHHLQQTEHVWVVDIPATGSSWGQRFYNNEHMVQTYEDVLGDQFTPVPGNQYQGDVWIQDEIQLAWMNAPGTRTDLVIDSIRDRGLDDFPEDEIIGDPSGVGPDVVNETWGNPLQANSLDSFGNLEISPPVTVDGVEYPFGRIYFGGDATRHPTRVLTDFLASQKIQKPFMPNTAWLCVGHIDEVTSVVPDPSSDIGFKFVIGDVDAAWEILEAQDPTTALPRYARGTNEFGHNLATVGALVNSNALRMENEEIQQDILDPMREQFMAELNLQDSDILRMPSLFENLPGCGDAALIPGMVNLIVANRGEQTDVFLADPFTRDSDDPLVGQDEDPVIAHVRDMMPDTLDLHFVDNWAVYHAQLGEVHCGTNMTRTPAADWWSVAGHLLEGE